MREIIIFEAEDGKQFEDRVKCEEYELNLKLQNTTLLIMRGRKRYLKRDYAKQDTYNKCTAVIVPDEQAVEAVKAIKEFTGFYYGIDSIGKWVYEDKSGNWIKTESEVVK